MTVQPSITTLALRLVRPIATRLGRWLDAWNRVVEALTPPSASPEVARRVRLIATFMAILDLLSLVTSPHDLLAGNGLAVLATLATAAVLSALVARWLKQGRVGLAGHALSGTAVVSIALIAADKGGLIATEVACQSLSVLLAVLVVGARGALWWTGLCCLCTVVLAATFELRWPVDSHWALSSPGRYAGEMISYYLTAWCLGAAFDRARSVYEHQLAGRNTEMQRVLEHARDGLLTIDRAGRIGRERSRQASEWLAPLEPGCQLWEALGRERPEQGAWLRLCWETIIEDVLPRELALLQIPRHVRLGDKTLEVDFTLLDQDGRVDGALILLHDVTGELARQRAESAQKDLLAVFNHIRTDASAVASFLREMDQLARAVAQGVDRITVLRDLHTMKGSASLFGVSSMVDHCHLLEELAGELGALPTVEARQELAERWFVLSSHFKDWLGSIESTPRLEVTWDDYTQLKAALAKEVPHAELSAFVANWDYLPAERVLQRLGRQARGIAERLGKEVDVVISPSAVRLNVERLSPVLTAAVHALRNALDHGIESPAERRAAGKKPRGELRFAVVPGTAGLALEIRDDGRGVAWDKVREKARRLGLPQETRADLVQALLSDGFSTRDQATLYSGRGIGLSALAAAVESLGGELTIESESGSGTTLRLDLPDEATASARMPHAQNVPALAASG